MKRLVFSFLIGGLLCAAQDIRDVQTALNLVATPNTLAASVSASQGDGTICKIVKNASSVITASLTCTSGDGKTTLAGTTFRSSGTTSVFLFGYGDVLCFIGANPTSAAVNLGFATVPSNGLSWSCSTNIRTNGAISGQTIPVTGSITYP